MQVVSAYSITTPRTVVAVDAKARTGQFTVDVKNEQPAVDRVVLEIEPVGAGTGAAAPDWFSVDRHLRPIPAAGSEQFLVSITVPKDAAVGSYQVRPVAYSSDHPPDDTKVDGPVMTLTVPQIPVPPRSPWWRRWWPWWLVAVGVLVAVAVAVIVIVVVRSAPVSVPSVVGLSKQQAQTVLTAHHLKVGSVTRKFDANHQDGNVTAQNPSAGTKAKRAAAVDLTIAENAKVPNVVGMQLSAASNKLTQQGFKVDVAAGSPSATPGTVLAVNPAPGTPVAKGSSVTIIVAAKHGVGPSQSLTVFFGQSTPASISSSADPGFQIVTGKAQLVVMSQTPGIQLTSQVVDQSANSVTMSVTAINNGPFVGFVQFRLEFDEIPVQ